MDSHQSNVIGLSRLDQGEPCEVDVATAVAMRRRSTGSPADKVGSKRKSVHRSSSDVAQGKAKAKGKGKARTRKSLQRSSSDLPIPMLAEALCDGKPGSTEDLEMQDDEENKLMPNASTEACRLSPRWASCGESSPSRVFREEQSLRSLSCVSIPQEVQEGRRWGPSLPQIPTAGFKASEGSSSAAYLHIQKVEQSTEYQDVEEEQKSLGDRGKNQPCSKKKLCIPSLELHKHIPHLKETVDNRDVAVEVNDADQESSVSSDSGGSYWANKTDFEEEINEGKHMTTSLHQYDKATSNSSGSDVACDVEGVESGGSNIDTEDLAIRPKILNVGSLVCSFLVAARDAISFLDETDEIPGSKGSRGPNYYQPNFKHLENCERYHITSDLKERFERGPTKMELNKQRKKRTLQRKLDTFVDHGPSDSLLFSLSPFRAMISRWPLQVAFITIGGLCYSAAVILWKSFLQAHSNGAKWGHIDGKSAGETIFGCTFWLSHGARANLLAWNGLIFELTAVLGICQHRKAAKSMFAGGIWLCSVALALSVALPSYACDDGEHPSLPGAISAMLLGVSAMLCISGLVIAKWEEHVPFLFFAIFICIGIELLLSHWWLEYGVESLVIGVLILTWASRRTIKLKIKRNSAWKMHRQTLSKLHLAYDEAWGTLMNNCREEVELLQQDVLRVKHQSQHFSDENQVGAPVYQKDGNGKPVQSLDRLMADAKGADYQLCRKACAWAKQFGAQQYLVKMEPICDFWDTYAHLFPEECEPQNFTKVKVLNRDAEKGITEVLWMPEFRTLESKGDDGVELRRWWLSLPDAPDNYELGIEKAAEKSLRELRTHALKALNIAPRSLDIEENRAVIDWVPTANVIQIRQGFKPMMRAMQKIQRCYGGDVSLLTDLSRVRLVFTDICRLRKCLNGIAEDPEIQIVRLENKLHPSWDAQESGGYRDVLIKAHVVNEETKKIGSDGHVVEVQLHCTSLFAISRTSEAQVTYVRDRNLRNR